MSCRGYPIEQLALHSSHLETAYLLIYGALPTVPQLKLFESEVLHHSTVHADAEHFFRSFRYVSLFIRMFDQTCDRGFRYDAHPMAILTSAFAYLGSYYREANPSLEGTRFMDVEAARGSLVLQAKHSLPKAIRPHSRIWTDKYTGSLERRQRSQRMWLFLQFEMNELRRA